MYLRCVTPTATVTLDQQDHHIFTRSQEKVALKTVVYWDGMSQSATEKGMPSTGKETIIWKVVALFKDPQFKQLVAYVFEEDLRQNFSRYW